MNYKVPILLAIAIFAGSASRAVAEIQLGSAGNFAVLAGSTVTSTGATVIDGGDVGVNPGTAITGFAPGILVAPFMFHSGDAVALQAQTDLAMAYSSAELLAVSQDLTGQDLGGLTLLPGVYRFSSSAQLTGTLTLDNQGDPNAQFVFQIGSTLTTASDSAVKTINEGSISGGSVFWQVGSSATLGTNTSFEGHILALTSITLNTGATMLDGSALALNGVVTLDSNRITNLRTVPEPGTLTLSVIGGGFLGLTALGKKGRDRRRNPQVV